MFSVQIPNIFPQVHICSICFKYILTKLHSQFLRLNCKVISTHDFHAVLHLCDACGLLVIVCTVSVKLGSVTVLLVLSPSKELQVQNVDNAFEQNGNL
jgi:hypothetical protein